MFDTLHERRRKDRVVLVTGCSSGIGLEIARILKSRPGYRLVVSSRKESIDKLHELGFCDSEVEMVRPLDITSDDERKAIVEEIAWRWGGVDVLVNNAGISYRAVVEHMTDEEEQHQLETNYLGPMGLIRLVLPHMRAQRQGHIINVSSVSGMMAMPTMSSYSASKFALEGASESLWYEMRPWNIRVTLVQPGFIRSDSFTHVYHSRRSGAEGLNEDEYFQYYKSMAPFVEKLMNASLTTAKDVAETVVNVMERKDPPLRMPATLDARLFYWVRRLLPRRIYHWLLYRNLPGVKNWVRSSD